MNNKSLRDKDYYQEGWNAYKQRKGLWADPYENNTRASDYWLKGWFACFMIDFNKKYPEGSIKNEG